MIYYVNGVHADKANLKKYNKNIWISYLKSIKCKCIKYKIKKIK